MSTDHDVLHGLDGNYDLHPGVLPVFVYPGLGRGHVWCFMGCLPGMPSPNLPPTLQLMAPSIRPFPHLMLVRWCLQSCARTLPRTSACVGAPAFCSLQVLSELSQALREILAGDFPSSCNGSGRCPFLLVLMSPLSPHGMRFDGTR